MRNLASCAYLWLVALSGCASAPDELPGDQSPHGEVRIVGHRCDGGQGIDGLAVIADKPGPLIVHWDNEGVCGKPA